MTLKILDFLVAEGTEDELVKYTALLLNVLRRMQEREKEEQERVKQETASFVEMLNKSFAQMMAEEQNQDDTKDEN